MGEFKNGDLVVTPTGRIAKVNRIQNKCRHDEIIRADLLYADNRELVILPLSLLRSHDGSVPKKSRKERSDQWMPARKRVRIEDRTIPILTPADQLLLMDGCMRTEIQGQAGGLARQQQIAGKKQMLQ